MSGLVGAIVGAIVGGVLSAIGTYYATTRAARKSFEAAAAADAEVRRIDKNDTKRAYIQSLMAEADHNTRLAENIFIGNAKIRFLTDAYEQAKRRGDLIPNTIVGGLQEAYSEVYRFNALADYDQEKIAAGIGTLDDQLRGQAGVVREVFMNLQQPLLAALREIGPPEE